MAATLASLARQAGIDPSLVSRLLRGDPSARISDEKRARILQLAMETGYRANRMAKSLRTQRTFILGMPTRTSPIRFTPASSCRPWQPRCASDDRQPGLLRRTSWAAAVTLSDGRRTDIRILCSATGCHLGGAAVAVLRTLPRAAGNPFVIVGKNDGQHLTDLQHPWRRIREAAGLQDVRIHDLRHTFASGGLAVGEGLPIIGKLLGHTQVQTTARYAHLAAAPVKLAADRIAGRLAAALLGSGDGEGDDHDDYSVEGRLTRTESGSRSVQQREPQRNLG